MFKALTEPTLRAPPCVRRVVFDHEKIVRQWQKRCAFVNNWVHPAAVLAAAAAPYRAPWQLEAEERVRNPIGDSTWVVLVSLLRNPYESSHYLTDELLDSTQTSWSLPSDKCSLECFPLSWSRRSRLFSRGGTSSSRGAGSSRQSLLKADVDKVVCAHLEFGALNDDVHVSKEPLSR